MQPLGRLVAAGLAGLAFIAVAAGCDDTNLRIVRDLSITAPNGVELLADVYRPPKRNPGRAQGATTDAAVVLIHGGGWTGGDKSDMADLARSIAAAGFVAVSVNYDTDGPNRYTDQQEQARQWVRYVQQRGDGLGIDPRRVGVLGVSAGGTLAMMVGVLGSGDASLPPVRAVASWSGASDLSVLAPGDGKSHPDDPPPGCGDQKICIGFNLPSAFTDYLGCTLDACPDRYAEASPVNSVTPTSPPMYLTAAAEDFIPFDQSERMADALGRVHVAAETAVVPGSGHAQTLSPEALGPTIEFFQRELR
jgi:acetyl esterase/lipase